MNCPHCEYQHGYGPVDDGTYQDVKGKSGNFYKLPLSMERPQVGSGRMDTVGVFGCPQCNKTFIS